MCSQFMLDRIQTKKDYILKLDEAMCALAPNSGVESYTLDTGQGRQTVTRKDIDMLQKAMSSAENSLVTLEARCYGSGVVQVRP